MLEQLLTEIRNGGTLDITKLAVRLGTSSQLIEAMLEHLERNGLIQSYVSCDAGCQGCNLQEACNLQKGSTVRLWQSKSNE